MTVINQMPIEFLGQVSIYIGIGIQVLMALFLGGIVGYDREKKAKSAGIKTNILICLGATLYTSVGMLISVGATGMADPNRVAAQIVSGIGFLGAGAIIQGQGSVIGMTTAATIWVVAAIGFTVGAGYPFTALIFTLTVLAVLKVIHPIYRYMESEKDYDYYRLEILSIGSIKKTVRRIMENEEFDIDELEEEAYEGGKKGSRILGAYIYGHRRHMHRIVGELKRALKVKDVSFFPVSRDIRAGGPLIKRHENGQSKVNTDKSPKESKEPKDSKGKQ